MTLDQFPPDQNRIIQALEKRIAALESQAGQVKGTPILRASGPFIIPSSSPPTPASGEIGFYSDNGEARWVDDGGGDHAMGVDMGGSVLNPVFESVALGTGAAVNGGQYNLLREDVFSNHNQIVNLLDELRGRIIAP